MVCVCKALGGLASWSPLFTLMSLHPWLSMELFLTSFPLCWADLVSRRVKTFPHTEISLHTPGAGSATYSLAGCITSTPLVVSPSIKPSDVLHLAARS